ncbi:MAG: hypothetical protein MJZ36_03185 [Bacteroidaceae bacterium]|nr:hypothetical protein [Bacteroidaceae bacterium]
MKTRNFLLAGLCACISCIFVTSCSQDDDYANVCEFTTLAKGVQTRSAEQPNQEKDYFEVQDSIMTPYPITLHTSTPGAYPSYFKATVYVIFSHDNDNKPEVQMLDYSAPLLFRVTDVTLEKDLFRELYILKATGYDTYNREFGGEYDHLFRL